MKVSTCYCVCSYREVVVTHLIYKNNHYTKVEIAQHIVKYSHSIFYRNTRINNHTFLTLNTDVFSWFDG